MEIFTQLPDELQYLAEPARKYGRFQFDADIDSFLASASETDIASLSKIAERFVSNQHEVKFQAFLDRYPVTDHEQSAQLYFLFHVMDAAGIDIESPDWNTVSSHMKSLERFGSFRLASERMHAAKFLADFGADAAPAIPLLQRARRDEDHRVRVWSNCALFLIGGGQVDFIDDIRSFLFDPDSEVRTEAASALGEIGEPALAAIPELKSLIESRDEDEDDIAIFLESLIAIGKKSPIVIETLLSASKSHNETIRNDAKEFLAELGVDT